jgi:hypothetical protein
VTGQPYSVLPPSTRAHPVYTGFTALYLSTSGEPGQVSASERITQLNPLHIPPYPNAVPKPVLPAAAPSPAPVRWGLFPRFHGRKLDALLATIQHGISTSSRESMVVPHSSLESESVRVKLGGSISIISTSTT